MDDRYTWGLLRDAQSETDYALETSRVEKAFKFLYCLCFSAALSSRFKNKN